MTHVLAVGDFLGMLDVVRGGHQTQAHQKAMGGPEMKVLCGVAFTHTVREDWIDDFDTEQIQAYKARKNDPTDRTHFDEGDHIVAQHTTHVIGELELRREVVISYEEFLNDLVLNLFSQLRNRDGNRAKVEEKFHKTASVVHCHIFDDQLFRRGVVMGQQLAVTIPHQRRQQAGLDQKYKAHEQDHDVREVKRVVPVEKEDRKNVDKRCGSSGVMLLKSILTRCWS